MWLLRSKMARFWTLWSAGFSALSATVSWLILTFVYPHGAKLSSAHTAGPDLLLPGILLNLFVFLYLAYSPSILEAFRVGED
jgi:fumarate reductase subunit D